MRRTIAFLLTLMAVLAVGVNPAAAGSSTFMDPYGDVAYYDNDAVTSGSQSGVDIRKMRVSLTDTALVIKTFHWDLTGGNAWDRSTWVISVNSYRDVPHFTVTNDGMEYYLQRTKTWWQVDHPAPSREVRCASSLRIRPDLDTTRLRIPRGCLKVDGKMPWRVREGVIFEDWRLYGRDVYDTVASEGRWVTKG